MIGACQSAFVEVVTEKFIDADEFRRLESLTTGIFSLKQINHVVDFVQCQVAVEDARCSPLVQDFLELPTRDTGQLGSLP